MKNKKALLKQSMHILLGVLKKCMSAIKTRCTGQNAKDCMGAYGILYAHWYVVGTCALCGDPSTAPSRQPYMWYNHHRPPLYRSYRDMQPWGEYLHPNVHCTFVPCA